MKKLACAFACSIALMAAISYTVPASADGIDDPRASPHIAVRERANYVDPLAYYWEGFELKNDGDCSSAIEHLRPIAMNGRGYESAQHALGLCLMSMGGLPTERGASFDTSSLLQSEEFILGRTWVLRAANAGHFQAQRTILALYAAHVGPDQNPVELGKWLQLYAVNPIRLTLGVMEEDDGLRQFLKESITKRDLLVGREQARSWTPTFWAPPGVVQ